MCLWCFDLLALAGKPLVAKPLTARRQLLAGVVAEADSQPLQFSADFDDGAKLLAVLESRGVEGVVSKRRSAPYQSGPSTAWLKTKTESWRAANRGRGEKFKRGGR